MGYCTYTDIQSEFKDLPLSTTSSVTIAEVRSFIDQTSSIIDSKISTRYLTPITGTKALLTLKYICIQLISNRIKRLLQVKTGETEGDQKNAESDDDKLWEKIGEIASGKMQLIDATLAVSGDGIRSYTYTNSIAPTFKRDENQW